MDYVIINVERSAKMDNKKIFSMNLKRQLEKHNLTPTEFSRKIGFNDTTVFNWLHCQAYPRIDRIQQMADFFGIYKSDLTEDKSNSLTNPRHQNHQRNDHSTLIRRNSLW